MYYKTFKNVIGYIIKVLKNKLLKIILLKVFRVYLSILEKYLNTFTQVLHKTDF